MDPLQVSVLSRIGSFDYCHVVRKCICGGGAWSGMFADLGCRQTERRRRITAIFWLVGEAKLEIMLAEIQGNDRVMICPHPSAVQDEAVEFYPVLRLSNASL